MSLQQAQSHLERGADVLFQDLMVLTEVRVCDSTKSTEGPDVTGIRDSDGLVDNEPELFEQPSESWVIRHERELQ